MSIANGFSIDVEEYWRIHKYSRELRKENGLLKESLAREQSINAVLTRRYESALSEASELQLQSKKQIEDLKREIKNCLQEIGFLQDQLDLRNQEVNKKEAELQGMVSEIEKLESSMLSIQLESECEIECLKRNITDLELRYLDVERFSQHIAKEKEGSDILYMELPTKFLEEQKGPRFLGPPNEKVLEKHALFEQYMMMVFSKIYDYLDKWLERNLGHLFSHGELDQSVTLSLGSELSLLGSICDSNLREVLDQFLLKLAVLLAWVENTKSKMHEMSTQIRDSEILLVQLKEELSTEKSRAKEEAEDLTQEMAELRYQITGLLEEECKHRSLIEHASLQRIQELEEEVHKLKQKGLEAIGSSKALAFSQSRPGDIKYLRKDFQRSIPYRRPTSEELSSHGDNVSCSSSHGPGDDNYSIVVDPIVVPLSSEPCDSWTLVVRQDQSVDCELITATAD